MSTIWMYFTHPAHEFHPLKSKREELAEQLHRHITATWPANVNVNGMCLAADRIIWRVAVSYRLGALSISTHSGHFQELSNLVVAGRTQNV